MAGNIEYISFEKARTWREIARLELSKLGIKVVSPMDEVFSNFPKEDELSFKQIKEMQAAGRFEEANLAAKKIRNKDLACVDLSTFLIVYLDIKVPTYGTLAEFYLAYDLRKPIFFIVDGGYVNLPVWLCSYLKPEWVFPDLDSALEKIKRIDKGLEVADSKYWRLLNEEFR